MAMNVERVVCEEELTRLAAEWNCLAHGVPFRGWEWVQAWWRAYSTHRELFVLTVRDTHGQLIGIAPFYAERLSTQGRILAFLGSGDVCSDYLTILSTREHEPVVAKAVAEWLVSKAHGEEEPAADRWDLLELEGVSAEDPMVKSLLSHLAQGGCTIHLRRHEHCWRIPLPDRLQDYLQRLSKSRGKQARRLLQQLNDNEQIAFHRSSDQDPEWGLDILIDLHQRRRQSLGQTGCFACDRFTQFVRDVTQRLHHAGLLEICWLEWKGRPVAMDLNVVTDEIVYAYQSGIEPASLQHAPGHMLFLAVIQDAILRGYRTYDFLRGDEAYKSHWRGQAVPLVRVRVIPARAVPRIRHGVWLAGLTMKNWLKTGWTIPR
jgi:CelD/BcsL family acetyltransferase involved in cellulose biosynthesis